MKRFIVWDESDGSPFRDGRSISAGVIGAVGLDNVYLRTYGKRLSGEHYDKLEVGQCVPVEFNLSGQRGVYSVYRIEDSEQD